VVEKLHIDLGRIRGQGVSPLEYILVILVQWSEPGARRAL
jgi:hypothetical protein